MATILKGALIRETGLSIGDKKVFTVLMPSSDGGTITFKEKGSKGKGYTVSLNSIMKKAMGLNDDSKVINKVGNERQPFTGNIENVDYVDLALLEPKIMIESEANLSVNAKSILFSIIREIREQNREDLGLPPLVNGSKAYRDKMANQPRLD